MSQPARPLPSLADLAAVGGHASLAGPQLSAMLGRLTSAEMRTVLVAVGEGRGTSGLTLPRMRDTLANVLDVRTGHRNREPAGARGREREGSVARGCGAGGAAR
jgi:hypothetical protein